jgi:hypothetical protein
MYGHGFRINSLLAGYAFQPDQDTYVSRDIARHLRRRQKSAGRIMKEN